MVKHAKKWLFGAVAAFVVIGFAACGSDAEEYAPDETYEEVTETTPAPTPTPVPTQPPGQQQPTIPQPIMPLPGEIPDFVPMFASETPLNLEIARNRTISAGPNRSMAITEDGALWAWGNNQSGVLGDGTGITRHYPVSIMDNAAAVSTGTVHSMAIDENGVLWSWGANTAGGDFAQGVVGDGTMTQHRFSPVSIFEDVAHIYA